MTLFSKIEKFKLIGLTIKAITGVIGGSLILTESHPYLTIAILAIGAAANECLNFLKDRENKSNEG